MDVHPQSFSFFFYTLTFIYIYRFIHLAQTTRMKKKGGGGEAQYPTQFMITTACLSTHTQGHMNKCETKSNASKRNMKVFIAVQVAILH